MTNGTRIRVALDSDRYGIAGLVETAFGRPDEARLVEALAADGDVVVELVAERDATIVGHVLFSPLIIETSNRSSSAVALAPLSVAPAFQRQGIGAALVEDAHRRLRLAGETFSVVLGDPDYYGRFGYAHDLASGFESEWQCEALQALAWGDAPAKGKLVYASAFSAI